MGTKLGARPGYIRYDYMAGEGWEFGWNYEEDFEKLADLWYEGASIPKIAESMKRPIEEVVVFIMDQVKKRKLSNREGGIIGGKPGITLPKIEVLLITHALQSAKYQAATELFSTKDEFTRKRLWNEIRRFHKLIKLFEALYERERR